MEYCIAVVRTGSASMLSPFGVILAANVFATLLLGVFTLPPSRIVRGSHAALGEFPFIISLRWKTYGHLCGGSIISPRHVLTAGHCADELTSEELNVVSGFVNEHDRFAVVTKVKNITMHPNFIAKAKGGRVQNDLAVLTLTDDLVLDGYRRDAIRLPIKPYVANTSGITAGWGYTQPLLEQDDYTDSSADLNKLNVTIVTHDVCRKSRLPPFEYQICATNTNGVVCQGDSGGPLVIDNVLVGVLSTSSCLIGSTPAFMDVYYFKDFIEKAMNAV
ncbi:chymotrypsin-2-like [Diachasmimorpha longicaudata]|uniref:chymotrypsin-2-like n=1 Tax=Diachasmimorpha longicaudata TaxID=58733 RepID=UPI0030B8DD07